MATKFRTPGHRMTRVRHATWCTCGYYLGGLGTEDGWLRRNSRERYDLHRLAVHNAQR